MAKHGTVKDKSWGTLGGNGHMHSFDGVGTQKPGYSSSEGSGGRRDQKAKGGSEGQSNREIYGNRGSTPSEKPVGNKYGAGPQTPGQSAASGVHQDGFAKGGTTKMFGNRGSQRCEPGKSAC